MERRDPDLQGDERTMLEQFLNFHRDTLLWKVEGLDDEQLRQTTAASSMLLGEEPADIWRDVDWKDDPDWEFRTALSDSGPDLIALYQAACEASRQAVASMDSLDATSAKPSRRTKERFSLRWILVHMIEETARHNGHADLLREAIDGATGE
jgi:Protein of unknown function (DUF664)